MLNLSQRRSFNVNGGREIHRIIDGVKAEEAAKAAEHQAEITAARAAARAAEKARPKLTTEDVRGARFVRTDLGWHKVVRVNVKSVTVETAYSWTDRYPLAKVLEVRA
jgi:hypothetical protein